MQSDFPSFVTSSHKKWQETQKILKFEVIWANIELQEIQGKLDEISTNKALEAAKILNKPVIVDDSALYLKALKSLPGPYVKYFLQDIGCLGIYKLLDGFGGNYKGTAACTYAFCTDPDKKIVKLFTGEVDGTIVSPRGDNSFGWDPIFMPSGEVLTYGEMTAEKKNSSSPRYIALQKLREYLHTKN